MFQILWCESVSFEIIYASCDCSTHVGMRDIYNIDIEI